jgi:integrase
MVTAMPDGYEIRGQSVRVYFSYKGKFCRERVGSNTPATIKHAKKLVQIINFEIDSGTFEYARHFPDSPKVRDSQFGHYLELFLQIKSKQLAASSILGHTSKSNAHIIPKWGHIQVERIDHIDVQHWISDELAQLSNKTIKEVVSIMSQTFDLYATRHKKFYNPCKGIKISLPDDNDPDPFTLSEIKAITTTETPRIQEKNMIEFMIWDGSRVSEAMALCWEDVVSLEEGIIRYQRAKVNGLYKATKTKRSTREHQLLKPAREALQRQWPLTGHGEIIEIEVTQRDNKTIRKEKIRTVFCNTRTGLAHRKDHAISDRFLKNHCKIAGVRYRPASQCRHTFISQMLTLGIVPLHWIAGHVGHSTIEMIQRKYGTWIKKDGNNVLMTIEKQLDL